MIVSFSDSPTIKMQTSYSKPMPPHFQYRSDGNEVCNLTHLYLQFPPGNTFLYIPQMSIKSVLIDKLIVCAFFFYPSIIQDDYPVGILDCFEPVGNGNDGASFNQRVDGFLYLHLIFRVERGGSFIQQDDLCVFQYGTAAWHGQWICAASRLQIKYSHLRQP